MASKTDKLFKGMSTKKIANVASMGGEVLDLPNYSGDHSAGTTKTPTADYHLTNKKYVDDNFQNSLSVIAPIQLVADTLSFGFSTDNTWTGENTFSGEVKGTKESIIMGHNRNLVCSAGVEKFLQIADTVIMTDLKGITMIRDGSIVGMSINFDLTGATGKISNLILRVKKNGTAVWEENVSNTITSNNKTDFKTQARGTDTFSAGDTISVCLESDGVSGSLTLSKVIVKLEYYYDD